MYRFVSESWWLSRGDQDLLPNTEGAEGQMEGLKEGGEDGDRGGHKGKGKGVFARRGRKHGGLKK